jgi:hypothetical protein
VDWLCAVEELQLLGVEIDPEYIRQWQRTVAEQALQKREKRRQRQETATDRERWERYPDSEGEFCFVAGYTSGGAPYGITREEAREQRLIGKHEPFGSPETEERSSHALPGTVRACRRSSQVCADHSVSLAQNCPRAHSMSTVSGNQSHIRMSSFSGALFARDGMEAATGSFRGQAVLAWPELVYDAFRKPKGE